MKNKSIISFGIIPGLIILFLFFLVFDSVPVFAGGTADCEDCTGGHDAQSECVSGHGTCEQFTCTHSGKSDNPNCWRPVTGTTTTTSTTSTTTSTTTTTTTVAAASSANYCITPASVNTAVAPNILFVIDASGSMGWTAYSGTYSTSSTYEGYFTPTKNYSYVSSGSSGTGSYPRWEETTSTASSCPSGSPSTSSVYSGNCLNFKLMDRIDLIRWAITGGKPPSCTGTKTFNNSECDPELYNQSGNSTKVGSECNDTIAGCIIQTESGTRVKVPWSRVNASLANTFKNLSIVPRMGALFFSSAGVDNTNGSQVYVGDFTAPNSTANNFPYMNLITAINSESPGGSTPTGPGMWDAYNYFAQNSPQYGGIPAQSGVGDKWKNPLYVCDGGGSNCVLKKCAKNFVILMSDGDWNTGGTSGYVSGTCTIDTGYENNSADPVVPAYKMHQTFTNAGATTSEGTTISTTVTAVYSIGLFLSGSGALALKNVAMYGSYDKTGRTWPGGTTDYPRSTCTMDDCGSGKGSGCTAIPATHSDWDSDGNGVPDTYHSASSASEIKDAIQNAVLDALRRASSGTAVSMLSTSEGSGATLIQAVFYPKRTFVATEIDWTGEIQNLWYYLDPSLNYNTMREDTNDDKKLNITQDYYIQFYFDTSQSKTVAKRYSDNGSGTYTYIDTVNLDDLHSLWRAGEQLHKRNLTSSPRTIYTTTNLSSLISFTGLDTTDATILGLLQASNATEAANIINYVKGVDIAGYRNRTVTVAGTSGVWKLGDIISSTPRIQSSSRLNQYHLDPSEGYSDSSYGTFINSADYKKRNMVYAGANDGMLHAFRLGVLDVSSASGSEKGTLCDETGTPDGKCGGTGDLTSTATNLGNEEWAFIPKNALSYLKYMADTNYCHLYYVDGPMYVFDASLATPTGYGGNYWDSAKTTTVDTSNNLTLASTSWRTILVGSMGQGGSCRYSGATCTDCVKSPLTSNGLSSYFALDVTTPASPSLLWEYSDAALGFSMAGPAIIRISTKQGDTNSDGVINGSDAPDNSKNGRWFAVFASGPTGPIDTSTHEFKGKSDQNLKLFVVDLKTGLTATTNPIDTGIPNAFATSFLNSPLDADRWNSGATGFYQDDVFYISYVKKCPSTNTSCTDTTWTKGGVIRVMTKNELDPTNWVVSTVIDDIGPVTTSVAKLQDRGHHELWLYFGTGRFFYKTDDETSQRNIYGIKEPCYTSSDTIDKTCTTTVCTGSGCDSGASPTLTDRTTDNSTAAKPANGWYINLAASGTSYKAERVITDPLAAPNGVVFFTTFAPTSDACSFGGNTYLWAVGYNTGTSSIDVTPTGGTTTQTKTVASIVKGKALIQVSTGSIEEKTLATEFATSRKSSAITGQPPKGQGLSIVVNPQPIKKILHIKEK